MRQLPAIRTRPARWIVASLVVLALGAPLPALAHEYWLSFTPAAPEIRQPVEVGAVAGTGFRGERKPFSPTRCVRLVAQAGRTLDLARLGGAGEFVWARFAPSDAGGAMFGYQSDFAPIELPGDEFEAYLALEGLDAPLAARRRSHMDGPGRERYRRCPKAWLPGSDVARAVKPLGLPLELVPLDRPGVASVLRLRVVREGYPLAGALVRAWHSPLDASGQPSDPANRDSVGVSWEGRSDSRGEVAVSVTGPGEWLVSVVHMEACRNPAVADWESTWSSLRFTRGRESSSR